MRVNVHLWDFIAVKKDQIRQYGFVMAGFEYSLFLYQFFDLCRFGDFIGIWEIAKNYTH